MVRRAARAARIDRGSHLIWKREDPEYRAAFEVATSLAVEALEDTAFERARYGTLKPVFHKGKICGYVKELSDTLLIFTLKAALPEKYRERATIEHTGKDGQPLLDIASVRAFIRDTSTAP